MALDQYIPAGRTSLIKQGELDLQVQTEYAYRPKPRITTTISASGRVVQKIERELAKPIESEEQQLKAQRTIVQQHAEVISLIEKRANAKIRPPAALATSEPPVKIDRRVVPDKPAAETRPPIIHEAPAKIDRRVVPDNPADYAEPPESLVEPVALSAPAQPVSATSAPEPSELAATIKEDFRSFYEQIPEALMQLPGVRQVFRLTNDGVFVDAAAQAQFKKGYKKIFKNLADLMELYGRDEGGIKRKVGVYEVQPDRLYFASSGIECYFIVVDEPSLEFNYEVGIKDVLLGR